MLRAPCDQARSVNSVQEICQGVPQYYLPMLGGTKRIMMAESL